MGGMSWVVEERPGMGLPVLHFAPGTLPSGGPRLPLAHSARSLATLLPAPEPLPLCPSREWETDSGPRSSTLVDLGHESQLCC